MSDLNVWYYRLMGDTVGPISSRSLRDLAKNGSIDFDTHVRKGTDGDWVSAASIKGLFQLPDQLDVPQPATVATPEIEPVAKPPRFMKSQNQEPIASSSGTIKHTEVSPPVSSQSNEFWTLKHPFGVGKSNGAEAKKRSFFEPIDPGFWNDSTTTESPRQDSMKTIGVILVCAGIAWVVGFAFYDTSVEAKGFGRVHNIGLQQNRLLGFVAGIATVLLGGFLLVFSKMNSHSVLTNSFLNSSVTGDQPKDSTAGNEKDCPFCAEKIKVNAKKCKHCGEFLP